MASSEVQNPNILSIPGGFDYKGNEQAEFDNLLTKSIYELKSLFEDEKIKGFRKVTIFIDALDTAISNPLGMAPPLRSLRSLGTRVPAAPAPAPAPDAARISNSIRFSEKIRSVRYLYDLWRYIQPPIVLNMDGTINQEVYIRNISIIIQFIFRRFQLFIPDFPTINLDTPTKFGVYGSLWRSIILENSVPESERHKLDTLFTSGSSSRGLTLPISRLDESAPNIPRGRLRISPYINKTPNKPRGTRKPIPLRNNKQTFKNKVKNLLKKRPPPAPPSYANKVRVPLPPSPFPLAPLISQNTNPLPVQPPSPLQVRNTKASLPQENNNPCPSGQQQYTDGFGETACCDPQDIWMVRFGNKVYTICGVLHGPQNKTKELSPPIDIKDSPELEQFSMTPSKSSEKPLNPEKCPELLKKIEDYTQKIEQSKVYLVRAKTFQNVRERRRSTRRYTDRLKKLQTKLKKVEKSYKRDCLKEIQSPNGAAPVNPILRTRSKRHASKPISRARVLSSLLLAWLALADAPKLNITPSAQLAARNDFSGSLQLVHYANLDNATNHTVHIIPAPAQVILSSAPVPMRRDLVAVGEVVNKTEKVPQRTGARLELPIPIRRDLVAVGEVVNKTEKVPQRTGVIRELPLPMGKQVVAVGEVVNRTERPLSVIEEVEESKNLNLEANNEQESPPVTAVQSTKNTRYLYRPNYRSRAPLSSNLNLAVVPSAAPMPSTAPVPARNLQNQSQQNQVPPTAVGTGRIILENGKTYFVQEISWAGTQYPIKVLVDKNTTGEQLYVKAYNALKKEVGYTLKGPALWFKGRVDKLTNIEGKEIPSDNTKIL